MGTGEDKQSGKGHCKSPIKCKTTQGEIPKITGAGEKRWQNCKQQIEHGPYYRIVAAEIEHQHQKNPGAGVVEVPP